jgi:hypothetical protein
VVSCLPSLREAAEAHDTSVHKGRPTAVFGWTDPLLLMALPREREISEKSDLTLELP